MRHKIPVDGQDRIRVGYTLDARIEIDTRLFDESIQDRSRCYRSKEAAIYSAIQTNIFIGHTSRQCRQELHTHFVVAPMQPQAGTHCTAVAWFPIFADALPEALYTMGP